VSEEQHLGDDRLVDAFGNACLRAGQSNSGFTVNAGAAGDWEEMQRWREALKARLRRLRAGEKGGA
jgi:hypothetical protein